MTSLAQSISAKLVAIYAVVFASFLSVGLILPLAPTTLVDRFGELKAVVGYSVFALALGGLTGRFIGGSLVDGRGALVGFTTGLFLATIGGACYRFIVSTPGFLLGRVVQGIGESIIYTAAATSLMNLVPDNKRSRYIGLLGSAVWGGISLGPAIGERLSGIEPAGLLTMATQAIGLVVVWTVFRNGLGPTERKALGVRIPRAALLPSVVVGLYNLGYAAISGFLILHLRERDISSARALTFYGLSVLFGRLVLGGIPDKIGPRPSITIGIAVMMTGLTLIVFAQSRPLVLGALMIFGVGYSMPFPALASLTVDRVSVNERASGLAVLGGMYDVFVGIAGLIFGQLADSRFGTTSIFVVAIVAGGSAMALSLGVVTKSLPTIDTRIEPEYK